MSREFIKKAYAFLADKKRTIIIVIGLAGIVLIFVSGFLGEKSESEPQPDEAVPITAEDYRKQLENGRIIYTRCSMGSGEIKYVQWQQILKRELGVTQEYFNNKK